jgi:hypothetical protein
VARVADPSAPPAEHVMDVELLPVWQDVPNCARLYDLYYWDTMIASDGSEVMSRKRVAIFIACMR